MEFFAKLCILWFSIVLSSHLCLSRQHCPLICISLMATLHIRFQHRSQLRIYRSGWKPLDCCGPVQAFVEVTNVCNSKCSHPHSVQPNNFSLDSSWFLNIPNEMSFWDWSSVPKEYQLHWTCPTSTHPPAITAGGSELFWHFMPLQVSDTESTHVKHVFQWLSMPIHCA